mmetsp:Transcript_23513/g.44716  ORF Transcript_23513/g.44716 Transcript_23513/m.44716 type:complete len:324 (-) Transcript_23513:43-1014(-)
MSIKFVLLAALIQIFLGSAANAADAANAASNLRARVQPTLSEAFTVWSGPHGNYSMNPRRARSIEAQTLTIVNNCADDITHFRASYNSEWVLREDGRTYRLKYDSTGTIPIPSGASITIAGVTSEELNFYALSAQYDWSTRTWDITEVANTPTKSRIWTHVTFNTDKGAYQFPCYREDIGNDMLVELCGSTPPATTVEQGAATLTINNNCGTDITHFQAEYNVEFDSKYQLQYESTDSVTIAAGASITIENVFGSDIHMYGLNAFYNYSTKKFIITDVLAKGNHQKSPIFTQVTFTSPEGSSQFPFYVEEIGTDMVVNLCGSN